MTPLPLAAAAMADEFRDPPEPMIPFGAVLKNSPYFDGHAPPRNSCFPNPLFSDTYKRSRRATAGKLLAISLRFFLVFKKSGISQKNS